MYNDLLLIHTKKDILALPYKFKENDNFILCYSDFEDNTNNIRNIIYHKKSNKIVSISHKRVINNNFDLVKSWITENKNIYSYEAFEGTHVNMYFVDDKWYFSTTSYLDASECTWKSSFTIMDLMQDCISKENWNLFLDNHNKDNIYNYIIQMKKKFMKLLMIDGKLVLFLNLIVNFNKFLM